MPDVVDLFISNPPFTRAGGPGDAAHTAWNPLFGSVLSKSDSKKMTAALRKTLTSTVGSLIRGARVCVHGAHRSGNQRGQDARGGTSVDRGDRQPMAARQSKGCSTAM